LVPRPDRGVGQVLFSTAPWRGLRERSLGSAPLFLLRSKSTRWEQEMKEQLDMADPRQCKPEYKVDFGEGRSVKPVDWAFCVNDSLAFFVEAKAVGKNIGAYDEQLGDYYSKGQPGVALGILTTGVHWRFFTDLDCEHVMDKKPFLEWDILKDDGIPYGFFTILQRTSLKPDLVKTFARGQHRQSLLVAELSRLLEPSPEFVRLAIQNLEELEDRKLTAAVIQEWKPILVRAIDE